jgi:hypothetical protein
MSILATDTAEMNLPPLIGASLEQALTIAERIRLTIEEADLGYYRQRRAGRIPRWLRLRKVCQIG